MNNELQSILDNLDQYSGPKGKFSDISQANASDFFGPVVNAAAKGDAVRTNVQVANADSAAQSRVSEIEDRIKTLKDEQDPSKYYLRLREDGGFDYFNPKGEQISLAKYSLATNKTADEILKKSGSNRDKEFIDRQEILNQIAEARYYGDKEKELELVKKYSGGDAEIEKAVKTSTVDDMVRKLAQQYADVLGDNFQQQGGVGVGADKAPTDLRSNRDKAVDFFKGLFD